jgi:hypothetical protein
MSVRERPLAIGQRVLIQPRRRNFVTKRSIRGVIKAVELEKSPLTQAWIYRVKQEDGVLNTYSDKQLFPLTVLDEMVLE